jgi:hypothetical protein
MTKSLAIVLLLLVVAFAWIMCAAFYPHTQKVTDINDCPAGFLDKIEACEGEAVTGFQNSGDYYFIARGRPRKRDCGANQASRLSEVSNPATQLDPPQLSEWRHDTCSLFPNLRDSKCFYFDRRASNGNTQYYLMAAFSDDCEKSIFFSGSQYSSEYFIEKIKF